MKIFIVGAGKVGSTLVENFIKEGHDVVIVDIKEEAVNKLVNKYDINGFIGGGLDRETLIEAGVKDCDFLIACTSKDEMNILCCILAKKLGVKKTIARVRDPQYFNEVNNLKDDLGLDLYFNPERRTAKEIVNILKFPSAISVEKFSAGKIYMAKFKISANNPIINKSVVEVSKQFGNTVLFAMIERNEDFIIPKGDSVFSENDNIYVIGSENDISLFCKQLNIFKPKAKSVFIIGGGKVAYYLAKELAGSGFEVKIMEKDKDRCDFLSQELQNVSVLLGDGTDLHALNEEDLLSSDACVTLTGMDEVNIVISLYAKQQKVSKVITKIGHTSIMEMVNYLGIDTAISPRMVISDFIIKFVRANQDTTNEGINSLYRIAGKAEVIEFTVRNSFQGLNIPLKDLKIEKNTLVGGIVRSGEFIIPYGDSVINEGDKVIIVTANNQIDDLNDIIK